MPKQSGIVTLRGTIGEFSYYTRNGVGYMRRKSSLSKSRILQDPKFKGFRDAIAEFKGHVVAAQSFADAFVLVLDKRDSSFHNRLKNAMGTIGRASSGQDGQRPVSVSEFKTVLKKLEFNAKNTLRSVCLAKFVSTPEEGRNGSTIQTTIVVPKMIMPPPIATHFRLVHALGVISDAVYDQLTKKYAASAPDVDGVGEVSYSDYISVSESQPVPVSLQTTLPIATIPENAAVIEAIGIEFFVQQGEDYKPSADGRAMRVQNVF